MYYWPTEPRKIPLEELGWVKTLYLASSHSRGDPTIVWGTSVQTEGLEQFVAEHRRQAGAMISIAHVLIWVTAQSLKKHQALNRRVIGKRLYPYAGVSMTLPVMGTRCGEVDALYLRDVEQMTLLEISRAVWEKAREVALRNAAEQRPGAKKSTLQRWTDWFVLHWILRMAWLAFDVTNLLRLPTTMIQEINACSVFINYLGFAGAPPMIGYKPSSLPSNSFGINVTMGVTEQKPVVENGQVVVRNVAPLFVRVDHRVANGYQTAEFLNSLREFLQSPSTLLAKIEQT